MGLDAVVLRPVGDDTAVLDDVVVDARLGNISMIGHLRERVARLLPPSSLLVEKVLYSGTHCGDALAADLMPRLKLELDILARDDDPYVRAFRQHMTMLADAATAQGTAITFV
ncbi:MAG: hypothetical protein ACHP7N_13735 [Caulobacterales bacterium]